MEKPEGYQPYWVAYFDILGFSAMAGASGHFFRWMLRSLVPTRGCLAFGGFYAGPRGELFGPALIAAHREAEGQDWVGLIVHPEAAKRMREYDVNGTSAYDVLRYEYREYDVPFSKNVSGEARRLVYMPVNPAAKAEYASFLCRDLHSMQIEGESLIDRQDMPRSEKEAERQRVRRKYENTKQFLLNTVPGRICLSGREDPGEIGSQNQLLR